MEFDLVINDELIERCFIERGDISYGYDIDANDHGVQFVETTIQKITWYKHNDNCDIEGIVTVKITQVYSSTSRNVSVQWHDKSYKTNLNAVRLLKSAKSELLELL